MIYLGLYKKVKRLLTVGTLDESVLITSRGVKVKRFQDEFAVLSKRNSATFLDLVDARHEWSIDSKYFKDCLASREIIEERFGKILGLDDEDTSE